MSQEQQFTFDTGPISRERLASALNLLASRFGGGVGGVMMVPGEREPDTRRGEFILKALEVVPRGLARRMNAVGGVLGAHSQPASEDQIMCPVCWEPLLEDGSFGTDSPSADSSGTGSQEGSPDSESSENSQPASKAILALPCRHIFHGSCLLPWLSRQTTCPSCRFNLDPEHLTFKPPPMFPLQTPIPQAQHPSPTHAGHQHDDRQEQQPVTGYGTDSERIARPDAHNLPTPTLIPAMSMIFAADPFPTDGEHSTTDPSAIPGLDPVNDATTPQPASGDNNSPPPNTFPPGFPLELQALLTAMFGDSLTPVQQVPPSSVPANQPQPGIRVASASDSAQTSSSPSTANFAPGRSGPTSTSGPSAQPTSEPHHTSATASADSDARTQHSNAPSGIMSTILGALFGGQVVQPRGSRTASTVNTGSDAPQNSDPAPTETPRPTPGPSFAFPPFRAPFSPFTNGHVHMPPASHLHLPRPFVMPPFPLNLRPPGTEPTQPTAQPPVQPPQPPQPETQQEGEAHAPRLGHSIPFFPFIPGAGPSRPSERKQWLLPEGCGASIRQRVEEKERQLGLRCYDPSCGFGPTDESPAILGDTKERVSIRKVGTPGPLACEHTFHTGCLVSAARVAGFGPEGPADGDVEVPCIVCRTHGYVEKDAWEEGVRQLQITDG